MQYKYSKRSASDKCGNEHLYTLVKWDHMGIKESLTIFVYLMLISVLCHQTNQ